MVNWGKTIALLVIFILIAPLAMTQHLNAKATSPRTIVVPDDFFSIKDAIDNASAGDTVFVRAGNYNVSAEGYFTGMLHAFVSLYIYKSISLIGENCQNTTLNVSSEDYSNPWDIGISVSADNVTISGFTIIGNKYVISLGGHNTLTNNIIKLNSTSDFSAIGAADGDFVSSNIVEGTGYGYGIAMGNNTHVSNNLIQGFNVGIASRLSSYNQIILDNTIANNKIGLQRLGTPILLHGNNIENSSQYSIALDKSGDVNATYNYWGTTNQEAIGTSIYDNKYDSALGTVNFAPYLISPNPQAKPIQNAVPSTGNSISLPTIALITVSGITIIVISLLLYRRYRKTTNN